MTTWREVTEACDTWIADAAQNGDLDWRTLDDWAEETADGCAYVIYTRHTDSLWAESEYTPVHEAEVEAAGFANSGDRITQRITLCVYLAIRDYLLTEGEKFLRSHSRWETYVGHTTIRSTVGGFTVIPVMKGRWVLDRDSLMHDWERDLLGMPPWVPCA